MSNSSSNLIELKRNRKLNLVYAAISFFLMLAFYPLIIVFIYFIYNYYQYNKLIKQYDPNAINNIIINKPNFISSTPSRTQKEVPLSKSKKETNMVKNDLTLFEPTKKVGIYLYINEQSEQWVVPSPILRSIKKSKVHSYNDIVSFELLENGTTITSGGFGRSVVGALTFGVTGAIIGGASAKRKSNNICTNLEIKITLNSLENPTEYIKFIQFQTKQNTLAYKNAAKSAQDCLSVLEIICRSVEQKQNKLESQSKIKFDSNLSISDELYKLKDLLENNFITHEEYNKLKQDLLK